ncbi:hypothetical protein KFL_005540080 [Klebsormidium nitens]|uniref:Uncharacterized protein n=1 Tax=Klebsormidium nitens TaxID=105231 RepID=A0A1Y1IGF7_KLENI|nr:hypothetical protein KFL_005540080 [Klebsormidium nitens]|eukprot:GAQ89713.1 hypothetical protein KFL_005540080 [Klebsormidium nitens]
MATAESYYDSSTRSGAQYMKEGTAKAPYGIDIPPTPGDEPSYFPQKGTNRFAEDKSGPLLAKHRDPQFLTNNPYEVVKAAADLALTKANTPLSSLFVGGFMSGAYLGFGGLIMTVVGSLNMQENVNSTWRFTKLPGLTAILFSKRACLARPLGAGAYPAEALSLEILQRINAGANVCSLNTFKEAMRARNWLSQLPGRTRLFSGAPSSNSSTRAESSTPAPASSGDTGPSVGAGAGGFSDSCSDPPEALRSHFSSFMVT